MEQLLNAVQDAFLTIGGLVILVTGISEKVDAYWDLNGWQAWLRSWVVAITLCLIGAYTNIGMFADEGSIVWYQEGLFGGLVIGLVANGMFSIPGAKFLMEAVSLREKPKEEN